MAIDQIETGTGLSVGGIALLAGEGNLLHLRAGPLTIKADGDDTGGRVGVWEDTVLRNGGPPLHIHHRADELFYVIDGELTFQVGDLSLTGGTGAFVFIPRGMAHTYQNREARPGRLLGIVTPSGLEQFYKEQAQIPPEEMSSHTYAAMAAKHDMDIIGPPLS